MVSALLDALNYIGGALDKPGRAVRGGLAGRPDELLAAIPFSDSAGWTDPSRAVSGRDLLTMRGWDTGNDTLDTLLGAGVEMALDPTTLIGGAVGARLGRLGGRALEGAAMARGPGYATTAEDLLRQVGRLDDPETAIRRIENIQQMAPQAFAEVPEGSKLLNAGAEGFAARTPAGDVVRVGGVLNDRPDGVFRGRPISPDVLQATRAADYPGTKFRNIRAERVPFAERVGDESYWGRPGFNNDPSRLNALDQRLEPTGLGFGDRKADNAGIYRGRDVVIDPGAVDELPGYAGGFQTVTPAGDPFAMSRAILDLLGGQPAMRRALDAGLAAPRYEQNLGRFGASAGASLGAL
ncbi:MAG TPA: hypothetical protein VFG68_19025 [Fimbriiglobus sp.]|nr:hypothetical protein [Fimbriiglobus sp.]